MFGFTGNGEPLSIQKTLEIISSSLTEDVWVNSCTCDVRSLRAGDLFVAITNDLMDGHAQIDQAIRLGCQAILAEREIPGVKIPYFVVKNSKEAYGILCHQLYGNPTDHLRVIGVTGTTGKTCTAFLIAGILAETGNRVGLISSLGIYDGEKMVPSSSSTPPANELAYWFSRMQASGCTDAVIEVSCDTIDQEHLAGIKLDTVCVTNIQSDHLDEHQTVEHYRHTKLGIFRYTKKSAAVICCADDPVSKAVLPFLDRPVLTTGIDETAQISGTLLERFSSEQTFLLTAGMETIPVRTRMIGDAHVRNSLLAAAFGLSRGIDLKKIIRGIERVDNIPARMERIDCGQLFSLFLDSAQTPEALEMSLKTVREITSGNVYCVFGAKNGLDSKKMKKIGETLEQHADRIILTADSLTRERLEEPIRAILRGITQKKEKVHKFRDRTNAMAYTLSRVQPCDAVLIVSGSHDESLDVPDYDAMLSDRAFVKEWLYENQEAGMI